MWWTSTLPALNFSHRQQHLGRDVVLYLTAHEVHHVGRIVAALRQLGFEDIPFMPRAQPAKGD